MAVLTGKLTPDRFGPTEPVHASAYTPAVSDFAGVDSLSLAYRTDGVAAAELLPFEFEIDERPIATVTFINYAVSSAGSYREFVQRIEGRFRGEDVSYTVHIYVDNQPALLGGREWLGWPKQLATIDFDTSPHSADGFLRGQLFRPAGVPLATALFRVGQRLDVTPRRVNTTVNLRVIPSAVLGEPPVVRDLIPSRMEVIDGQVWTGDASLHLSGISAFDPLHRLPVIDQVTGTLLRNATLRLSPPKETFPI